MSSALIDNDIDQLAALIRRQMNGRVHEFYLLVQPDGLILQGRALTYHAKQLAQHSVIQATRMPILANEIDVVNLPEMELAVV